MSADWERELTRLERDVHAALALLADGGTPPAERWSPPAELGPLPDSLRPRVDALLTQLAEASSQASTRRDELGKELTRLHQRRDAARAYQTNDLSPYGSTSTT